MTQAQQVAELLALLNKMDTSKRNVTEELKRSLERPSPKQALRNMQLA